MNILLASDPGGHLAVLDWLRPALTKHSLTWATAPHPHADALLRRDDVVFGVGPTSRNALAFVRNFRVARRRLSAHPVDLVISAGAGFGVPWLLAARARGTRTVFIEVVDRVAAPSLSGRLVRPWVDDVWLQTVAQLRAYPRGRVIGRLGPPVRPTAQRTNEVFVAFGTHHAPFVRLVRACEALADAGHLVVVQHGHSPCPQGCVATAWLSPDQFLHHMDRAAVVVLHGGSSSIAEARAGGRQPIVVARDASRGEHVDNHQQGVGAVRPEELAAAVASFAERPVDVEPSEALEWVRSALDAMGA